MLLLPLLAELFCISSILNEIFLLDALSKVDNAKPSTYFLHKRLNLMVYRALLQLHKFLLIYLKGIMTI